MSETLHSPLPWRAECSMEIHDADGRAVGECWMVGDDPFSGEAGDDPADVLDANRSLIVRAVNAHADLLAVALAYQRWEADLILDDNAWLAHDTPKIPQHLWDRLLEIQAMRNAAVALAEGKAKA